MFSKSELDKIKVAYAVFKDAQVVALGWEDPIVQKGLLNMVYMQIYADVASGNGNDTLSKELSEMEVFIVDAALLRLLYLVTGLTNIKGDDKAEQRLRELEIFFLQQYNSLFGKSDPKDCSCNCSGK